MNKRIKDFIEQLFAHTPSTTYVEELKEEMLMNLSEKYEDLLVEGKSKDEAYLIVTSSVGDIRELISGLDESAVVITTKDLEIRRRKSALITSISVAMYILCGAVVIGMSLLEDILSNASVIGVVLIIPIVAIATGMLIFDNVTKPDVLKEGRKYSQRTPDQKKREDIQEAITSILWIGTVAVYLAISFTMGAWAYSWIIFIISAAIQSILELIFKLKE